MIPIDARAAARVGRVRLGRTNVARSKVRHIVRPDELPGIRSRESRGLSNVARSLCGRTVYVVRPDSTAARTYRRCATCARVAGIEAPE